MVQIFIGNDGFELISYPVHVSNCLKFEMLPGEKSFVEIMALISDYTGDYIIKADGEVVARYANFTELIAIEQKEEEGRILVKVSLEHPLLDARVLAIEQTMTTHSTSIEGLDGSVSGLNTNMSAAQGNISTLQGEMSTANANISDLNEDVQTAQTDINNVSGALSTTNQNVQTIDANVTTQGNTINLLQEDLNTTKDAVDYLIMNS